MLDLWQSLGTLPTCQPRRSSKCWGPGRENSISGRHHKKSLSCTCTRVQCTALEKTAFSVTGEAALQRGLKGLFGMRQGKFDFSQEAFAHLSHELNFTRREVWQLLATAELTPETTDEHFSTDKATRFKLSSPGYSSVDDLPENLQTFLQRAQALLASGGSAAELADALDMHVPLVQLYLMRLRSLGKITPVRAYAPSYKGYSVGYSAVPLSTAFSEKSTPLQPPQAEIKAEVTPTPVTQQT